MQTSLVFFMAVVHFAFFFLESFYWGKPFTNKAFRQTESDARAMKVMAFNQGFYNLFLVVALIIGLIGTHSPGFETQARTLKDYAAASIFGAGIVLMISERRLFVAALVQSVPALLYGMSRFFGA